MASGHSAGLTREGLDALTPALGAAGYRVCGPIVRDQAIVYDGIAGMGDLPGGLADAHDGHHYRLKKTGDTTRLNDVAGPQPWKKHKYPPRHTGLVGGVDHSPGCPSVHPSPDFS